MTITIRPCAVSEIEDAPNLAALLAEYGEESAIDGLGGQDAQIETYHQMEDIGALFPVGAFDGDALVGFLLMIVSILPHYGKRVASSESFFVTNSARKKGAGLKLLREAERMAQDLGALGLFISAPMGSRLYQVLEAKRYAETNRIFFKAFS